MPPTDCLSMKRRQYLTGVGGIVGSVSIFTALSKSSCTEDAHEWVAQVEDVPVSVDGGEITVTIDGFIKKYLSWSVSNGQHFGTLVVEKPSCGEITTVILSVPEVNPSCHRLVLFIKTEESLKRIFAQYIQQGDDWVPVEVNDVD